MESPNQGNSTNLFSFIKNNLLMRIVSYAFFILLSIESKAQTNFYTEDVIAKIISIYGNDWYQSRLQENSSILKLFDNYISNGFSVEEILPEKYQDEKALKEIPLVSKNNQTISIDEFLINYQNQDFNPLKYKFFPQKEEQLYFLKDQNKIIRIKSLTYLNSL